MPRGPALTDWQVIEALRLRDAGATFAEIAADLGRSPQAWWARIRAIEAEAPDR